MPSPGGQVSGMGEMSREPAVRGDPEVPHPVDLHKGYHAATRGAELPLPGTGGHEGCTPEHGVIGLRQVDGMGHHGPSLLGRAKNPR
jgi:hypothetical protein